MDDKYRDKERERERTRMQLVRKDDIHITKEREANKTRMQLLRETEYRKKEAAKDKNLKKNKRLYDIYKYRENYINQLRRINDKSSLAQLIFFEQLESGPVYVCCCCERLFFKHSVIHFEVEKIKAKLLTTVNNLEEFLLKIINFNQTNFVCKTCYNHIIKGDVPKMATSWGMKFPEIPECIKILNKLEERMIAPILNFMQIRPLKQHALNPQMGMKGSVVNIMIEIDEMLEVLPRSFDNMAIVQVKLKRHIEHKSDYMFETVRPGVICEALKYLIETPLYKKYGITPSSSYLNRYENNYNEKLDFVVQPVDALSTDSDGSDVDVENMKVKVHEKQEVEYSTDSESDIVLDDDEVLIINRNQEVGHEESLTKIIAPGQGLKPIPWHIFPDLDELCFPTIFAGQPITTHPKLSYSERAKSEATRVDRRSCVPERLLFMAKCKMERSCSSNINICLRKMKKGDANVRAKDVLNDSFIKEAVKSDNCYTVLRQTRSSPAYWESRKKEVLAMIRQLGNPTFFLTLSSAEQSWIHLLKFLIKFSNGKNASELEILNMDDYEKTLLVRNDPVTCARYFDYKINKFIALLKSHDGPFHEHFVTDSYERVEFQQRGSPHEHIFLWCNDSPKYNKDSEESRKECIEFIDKHITCEYVENNPLMSIQRHKHTDTCYKGKRSHKVCRFGYPLPVMPRTMILEPLEEIEKTEIVKKNYVNIKKLMYRFYMKQEEMAFDEILSLLKLTETEYITAIRFGIDKVKVFLKRNSMSVATNCYNSSILTLFYSNMDLQFVLDPYSCASYIINYISKVEAGLSRLLKEAASEINNEKLKIRERLRKVTNVFLNSNLMSAQEAAYHVLGLPLSKSSRACIYINTSPSEERVFMLKPKDQLKNLDPDSDEITLKNIIQKYAERSENDEKMCLADFSTEYKSSKNISKNKKFEKFEENEDEDKNLINESEIKRKILRYRRYKLGQDEYNFYREQVLLFFPWRDETHEIVNNDCKELYQRNIEVINRNRKKYHVINEEEMEQALELAQNHVDQHDKKDYEDMETDELPEGYKVDIEVQGATAGNKDAGKIKIVTPPKEKLEDLFNNLRRLNEGQREIVMHIFKHIKTETSKPLRLFLSGAAGVGKSVVISVLFQLLSKYFDEIPGGKSDSLKVLLTAPTGKAAFLINGVTIHSAFCLPVIQFSGQLPELSSDVSNALRAKLVDMKLLIIDEGSMVGSRTLSWIDTRLRQVMGRNVSFGGISVLIVGDLHQLVPVMDSPLWKAPKINELSVFNERNPLWEEFVFYELKEIMRQKGDKDFICALNNVASNEVEDEDIKLFRTRIVQPEDVPEDAIRLYPENAMVNKYNEDRIKSQSTELFLSTALDTVLGNVTLKTKDSLLASLRKKKITELQGLPNEIKFKLGIKYMVTFNVDVEDGLVNGACGILRHITIENGIISRIWLEFPGTRLVGSKIRQKFADFMEANGINKHLVPIMKSSAIISMGQSRGYQVFRKQFPIVPAEAITIHKSQGQTYSSVCIDFRNIKKATRQLIYVAFSRVTSLRGLYILGDINPKFFHSGTTSDCTEIEILRKNKVTQLCYNNFKNVSGLVLVYHNVRSLTKYLADVQADHWYSKADCLIFSETRTKTSDRIEMSNYAIQYRSDENSVNGQRGLICLAKNFIHIKLIGSVCYTEKRMRDDMYKGVVDMICIQVNNIFVITGYKSPAASAKLFLKALDEMLSELNESDCPIVLIGDFNFDFAHESSNRLRVELTYRSLLTALNNDIFTTNMATQIDIVCTNIKSYVAGVYESYFSDHKPIFIELQNESIIEILKNPLTEISNNEQKYEALKNTILKLNDEISSSKDLPIISCRKLEEKMEAECATSMSHLQNSNNKVVKIIDDPSIKSLNEMNEIIERRYTTFDTPYYNLNNGLIKIYKSDLLSLKPVLSKKDKDDLKLRRISAVDGWLTDSIIDGFLFKLTEKYCNFSFGDTILSQYVVGTIDDNIREEYIMQHLLMSGKKLYAIPININNIHWIIVCIRLDKGTYSILDPQRKSISEQIKGALMKFTKLVLKAAGEESRTMSLVPLETAQQKDSYNCGVFICWFAKQFATNGDLNDRNFDPDKFRLEIFKEITSQQ